MILPEIYRYFRSNEGCKFKKLKVAQVSFFKGFQRINLTSHTISQGAILKIFCKLSNRPCHNLLQSVTIEYLNLIFYMSIKLLKPTWPQ